MTEASRPRVEQWPLDRLRPSPANPRTHPPEQLAQIARSIEAFGWTNPILADAAGEIIAGAARWQAAGDLGLATVPVIVLDDLTEVECRAYRIADNRIPLGAGWDDALLEEVMRELEAAAIDIGLVGFTEAELTEILPAEFAAVQAAFPALPDGDRSAFRQMTFALHESQAAIVTRALAAAKAAGDFDTALNANSNGNALARVCQQYLDDHGPSETDPTGAD